MLTVYDVISFINFALPNQITVDHQFSQLLWISMEGHCSVSVTLMVHMITDVNRLVASVTASPM